MLLPDLKAFVGKFFPNALTGKVIIGFPFECLANELAFDIADDLAFTMYFNDIVTKRRFGWPVTAEEHFLYPRHTFLPAELIVEFTEEEQHLLLHLSGGIGGVYGLRHRYDLDTEFSQLIGKPYGIVVTRE